MALNGGNQWLISLLWIQAEMTPSAVEKPALAGIRNGWSPLCRPRGKGSLLAEVTGAEPVQSYPLPWDSTTRRLPG